MSQVRWWWRFEVARSVQVGDMTGKVAVITGATSGIGLSTAKALAGAGASIVMVARDAGRAAGAVSAVGAVGSRDRVQVVTADLASLAEARRLPAEIGAVVDRVDVLINDAGVDVGSRTETVDGLELTWAVNYFAPFVLTTGLLPLLTASAPARIVNVVSSGHRGGKVEPGHLERDGKFSGQRAYNDSKLALVMFTYELARRLAGTGVTANAADPGFVKGTQLGRTLPRAYQLIGTVLTPFMVTPARGAQVVVTAASAPELAATTGAYLKRDKQIRSSGASYDTDVARRLWDATATATEGG